MEGFLLFSNGYMPNINMKILKLCDLVLIRLPNCLGEKFFPKKNDWGRKPPSKCWLHRSVLSYSWVDSYKMGGLPVINGGYFTLINGLSSSKLVAGVITLLIGVKNTIYNW